MLTRTPGQIAYETYSAARDPWWHHDWEHLPPEMQRVWEAVAEAVLDAWQAQPRLETPAEETPPCPT